MACILVIDDEDQIRSLFKRALEGAGHVVRTAADGEAGCKLFQDYLFDVVVCDVVMPNKEGIETIIDLRKNSPEVKILAVSGGGRGSGVDYLGLARRFGADSVLGKPVRIQTLVGAVARLLGETA